MSQDKELEIRRQFLDEAQEYLDTLDRTILGLADHHVDAQKMNAALRAAHSIKGGAGMMGFEVLSALAHRLEDFLKVLKVDKTFSAAHNSAGAAPPVQLENLLLSALTGLRQVIERDRTFLAHPHARPPAIHPAWLAAEVTPIFDQLHEQLGDPQDENAGSILSPEDGQEIIPLLFETEVEGCLQRLEAVVATPMQPCLREELAILAQELGGLGEMLQLSAFTQLCESVTQRLENDIDNIGAFAQQTLQAWRHAQTSVLSGRYDQIPTDIEGETFVYAIDSRLDPIAGYFTDEPILDVAINPAEAVPAENDSICSPVGESVDWYTDILSTETVAVSDDGYTDYQPTSDAIPFFGESQVSDFKVLEADAGADDDQDITVRVPARQLNLLNDLFGELTIDRNGIDLYLKQLRTLAQGLRDRIQTLDAVNAKLRTAYDKISISGLSQRVAITETSSSLVVRNGHSRSGFDLLELDQYTDLNLQSQQVMETIVQLQEVAEDIELSLDDSEQAYRGLTKTAKQMQAGLTQLRMRPLSDVADRFPRAVREWSLQYGKQVRLNIIGGGTLIDRNILETLNDPLMHLLRNAFDHGIETPTVRQAQGKLPEGVIEIEASQQGNRTVITVRDDGEGIPLDRIRDRAQHMGLDPVLLAGARQEELLSLIFEPGFSTREQVSSMSGRGVGMDVVRSNLKQIRGEIAVNTEAGRGTTFTLSVPFTLSTVRVLLVESAGMLLAFPTDVVTEMFLLKPEAIITTAGSEVINWQGTMVQVVRLHKWLHFNCPRSPHGYETPPSISSTSMMLIRQGDQLFGIPIDRCWGEQEATNRRVEGNLALPYGFGGCTILGNGRVVPLINASELLRWISNCERSSENALDPLGSYRSAGVQRLSLPQSSTPTVLVVDDSINVRRFLALTLERAGYRVEQAKDGQDALERLEDGLSVQAVVCDIEMPRLDGFGFLAKAKVNPTFTQVPIVMLTSRTGEKHRKLAESLGATAYFSKPYNEQELLQTLGQTVSA
ncbi:hybrid sensor histidine kinase/response regulator [Myxacorys almedinensis]|uniref:histidine kinase n=1 Tax=Myxacorys almedinensis A TaxID=2690445 RepID=A0A8J7ZCL9_9CYAN|nr:hybrid sensor histidine kinase/response regulator [Myxacorys almedinensis]NDJ19515.1 response regulator [Myxacorys almedinensis A]